MNEDSIYMIGTSVLLFLAVFMGMMSGWPKLRRFNNKQAARYDLVLNQELLLEFNPHTAVILHYALIVAVGSIFALLGGALIWFIPGAAAGLFVPQIIINHLIEKRRAKLDEQLVDGITTLASGVRAGLTLVQSMELLAKNSVGPIKQEFENLLREYELGLPLEVCMTNTSNRIGLQNYRLLFTAIQAHRDRGGNVGESLDRIAEAVREIRRLEGKLQTLTAQGRNQANMIAAMPIILLLVLYMIMPDAMSVLFTEPSGRVVLLIAGSLIVIGFFWIRRIMAVSI